MPKQKKVSIPDPTPSEFSKKESPTRNYTEKEPTRPGRAIAKKRLLPQKIVRMTEDLSKAIGIVARDLNVSEQGYLHELIESDVKKRLHIAKSRAIQEIENIDLDLN